MAFPLDLFPGAVRSTTPDGTPCTCADCGMMTDVAARVCDAVDGVAGAFRVRPDASSFPEQALQASAVLSVVRVAISLAVTAGIPSSEIAQMVTRGADEGQRYGRAMQKRAGA